MRGLSTVLWALLGVLLAPPLQAQPSPAGISRTTGGTALRAQYRRPPFDSPSPPVFPELPKWARQVGLRVPESPEERVTYASHAGGGAVLAGTLTLPDGRGPFPAVLLISGSGPNDRDYTASGLEPFRVLAHELAHRGVASLRYDERGVGGSTDVGGRTAAGEFRHWALPDLEKDARAGLAYLRGRTEIDAARVGLIGHSEGGLIAARLAAERAVPQPAGAPPPVAFVVLLATPAVPGRELVNAQSRALDEARGVDAADIRVAERFRRRFIAAAAAEEDTTKLRRLLRRIADEELARLPKPKRAARARGMKRGIAFYLQPWSRFFIRYDPAPALRRLRCPVLALFGSEDLQVAPDRNLAVTRAALLAGGNRDHEVRELPGLSHALQEPDPARPWVARSDGPAMAPLALDAIVDWVASKAGAGDEP